MASHLRLPLLPSSPPRSAAQITAQPPPPRRTADYQPSLWDNDYIQSLRSDHTDEAYARRIEVLKEEVRRLIVEKKEAADQIALVDALRQLGVAYHFEKEIKDALGAMSASIHSIRMALHDDLHATSLLFRILREHGFDVSQVVFDSFKDETGDFKACLCEDTKGMLSLYEASYLAMKGEDTLDEARAFTTNHLKGLMEKYSEPCVREHVTYALEIPLYWRAPRLHVRWFINACEKDENMNPIFLELAKLEFNMVQSIHQTELKDMSRWWTNLGLGEKLGFARDRLMEFFLVAVGVAFEPKFRRVREGLTKFACLVTSIDDVYDVYGSMDELELFTDAISRWDVGAVEQLPEYMKICFLALFNTVNEVAYDVLREKGLDSIQYLKKAWGSLCKSYLVEATWYHSGHTPTFKEYMDNATISISVHLMLTYAYFCVNQNITNEALDCLESCSKIICRSSMISRIWDDFGTSTAELKRGDVPKSIQCYMHENGVSEAVAREHIKDLISDIWKEFNGDCFLTSPFQEPFISIAINFPRVAHFLYQHGDGVAEPGHETKDQVLSLLIKPISLE